MFNYDGRMFRAADDGSAEAAIARYHQQGNVVWGEFTGGQIRRGSIAGVCGPGGILAFGYCMVLANGEVISGRCHSHPSWLGDGRIRLTERWERYGPHAATGVSYLEEVEASHADRR